MKKQHTNRPELKLFLSQLNNKQFWDSGNPQTKKCKKVIGFKITTDRQLFYSDSTVVTK